MKRPFPTELAEDIYPLREVPNLSKIGHRALDRLEQRGQMMYVGLREADLDEVLDIAVRPEVVEWCPKDATSKRFRNGPGWAEKGRGPFQTRSTETGRMTRYDWGGPEPCAELPHHPNTTAYRGIVPGTGKAAVVATVEGLRALYNDEDGYGLETWGLNWKARDAYEAVGAVFITSRDCELNKTTGEMERITRPTLDRGPDAFIKDGQWVKYDERCYYALPDPGQFVLPESTWQPS